MNIEGIDCSLIKEATIVLMQGTDGMYYAQSSALCKGKTPEEAVRRCVKSIFDYESARRYDMYQNGEIKQSCPSEYLAQNAAYENLLKRSV